MELGLVKALLSTKIAKQVTLSASRGVIAQLRSRCVNILAVAGQGNAAKKRLSATNHLSVLLRH